MERDREAGLGSRWDPDLNLTGGTLSCPCPLGKCALGRGREVSGMARVSLHSTLPLGAGHQLLRVSVQWRPPAELQSKSNACASRVVLSGGRLASQGPWHIWRQSWLWQPGMRWPPHSAQGSPGIEPSLSVVSGPGSALRVALSWQQGGCSAHRAGRWPFLSPTPSAACRPPGWVPLNGEPAQQVLRLSPSQVLPRCRLGGGPLSEQPHLGPSCPPVPWCRHARSPPGHHLILC